MSYITTIAGKSLAVSKIGLKRLTIAFVILGAQRGAHLCDTASAVIGV